MDSINDLSYCPSDVMLPTMNGSEEHRSGCFASVHDEFRPKILRYLARMAGEADAEDLTQEVFMKVAVSLHSFRGEASLATWIYRIATNTALDHLRTKAARKKAGPAHFEDDAFGDAIAMEMPSEAHPPDALLIHKDMSACIRGMVNRLPEHYRTALTLSDLEGLTNGEIAGVLGLSVEAAKMRLHRARARLRKEMQSECVLYHDSRNELACDRKPIKLGSGLK